LSEVADIRHKSKPSFAVGAARRAAAITRAANQRLRFFGILSLFIKYLWLDGVGWGGYAAPNVSP
jgi:hypothetical protein